MYKYTRYSEYNQDWNNMHPRKYLLVRYAMFAHHEIMLAQRMRKNALSSTF